MKLYHYISTLRSEEVWNLNFSATDTTLTCEVIVDFAYALIWFILAESEAFFFSGIICWQKEGRQL